MNMFSMVACIVCLFEEYTYESEICINITVKKCNLIHHWHTIFWSNHFIQSDLYTPLLQILLHCLHNNNVIKMQNTQKLATTRVPFSFATDWLLAHGLFQSSPEYNIIPCWLLFWWDHVSHLFKKDGFSPPKV